MKPFVEKVERSQAEGHFDGLDDEAPLGFLKEWSNPIGEDDVSQLTEPGRDDAFSMGKRMRELYGKLLPPKHVGHGKGKGKNITVSYPVSYSPSQRL